MDALLTDSSAAMIRETPERLHPALWLAHQLGRQAAQAMPTGHAALDAELPGGGWPRGVVSELLLPHPGVGEIRLLSPCLVDVQQAGRVVMLFDPPAQLSAWALGHLGLDVEALLVIQTRSRVLPTTDGLWALEQALKSGHVGAVLAWLPPGLRPERLRRLQLAAQAHDGPAFLLRDMAALQRPTAAPLRLVLRAGGVDVLSVHIAKRRGPPLEMPIALPLPPVLSEASRRRADRPITEGVLGPITQGVPDPITEGMGGNTAIGVPITAKVAITKGVAVSMANGVGVDSTNGVAEESSVALKVATFVDLEQKGLVDVAPASGPTGPASGRRRPHRLTAAVASA